MPLGLDMSWEHADALRCFDGLLIVRTRVYALGIEEWLDAAERSHNGAS